MSKEQFVKELVELADRIKAAGYGWTDRLYEYAQYLEDADEPDKEA